MKSYNSRWGDEKKLDKDGKHIPVRFGERDLEICKLLCSARAPWGYHHLPTSYFAPLLGRGQAITKRLAELRSRPYRYIQLSEQPRNNYRDLIYELASAGLDELREAGLELPSLRSKRVPHELMCSIIAASFEYGARQHGLVIDPAHWPKDAKFRPDWPPFTVSGHTVFIEADMASETLHGDPSATTIAGKIEHYLTLLQDRSYRNAIVLFVTTRRTRMLSMIEVLKHVIDKNGHKHELAMQFAFNHIEYDRFINTVPKLTDWAVKANHMRAGKIPPLNFLQP